MRGGRREKPAGGGTRRLLQGRDKRAIYFQCGFLAEEDPPDGLEDAAFAEPPEFLLPPLLKLFPEEPELRDGELGGVLRPESRE